MNPAHFHLIFNHLPIVGLLFSIFVLIYALISKSQEVKKFSFIFLFLASLTVIPAFLTGEPAEKVVEDFSGVTEELIHEHEEMAEAAFITTLILGVISLAAIIYYMKKDQVQNPALIVILILAMSNFALLGKTGNLGGQILHQEVRKDFKQGAAITTDKELQKSSPNSNQNKHREHDDDDD